MPKQHFLPALLIGLFVLSLSYGFRILDPTYVSWLYTGDSVNHYIGWMFFRNEAWKFPIGRIDTFLVPLGATLTQMDSIPVMGVLFKTLDSFIPKPFQYFGIWHLLCIVMHAYWGSKIAEVLGAKTIERISIAILFAVAPVHLHRFGHHALCGQFCILIGIWGYLKVAIDKEKPPFLIFTASNLFFVGVHPYLVAMSFPIFLAAYYRSYLDHRKNWRRYISEIIFQILTIVILCWIYGYFQIRDVADVGFGGYSTDLLTFFNSMATSAFLPKLRRAWGQYEGFAYLGLGLIIALLFNFRWYWKNSSKDLHNMRIRMRPLFWVCLALFVFAMGTPLTVGGNGFLDLSWLYDRLGKFPGAFRATGRFVWTPYYALMTFTLWVVFQRFKSKRRQMVLGCILAIQLMDLVPRMMILKPGEGSSRMRVTNWERFGSNRNLNLVPNRMNKGDWACHTDGYEPYEMQELAIVAGFYGWSTNSGFASRVGPEIRKICDDFWEVLPKELENPHALFAVHPKHESRFFAVAKNSQRKLHCEVIDEFKICD